MCVLLLFPEVLLSFSVSPFKAPRNLQTSEPTKTSFRVSWDPAPGDVKGYKVTFHPSGNDVDLGELLVGPYDSTVVLEELRFGSPIFASVFIVRNVRTKFQPAKPQPNDSPQ